MAVLLGVSALWPRNSCVGEIPFVQYPQYGVPLESALVAMEQDSGVSLEPRANEYTRISSRS